MSCCEDEVTKSTHLSQFIFAAQDVHLVDDQDNLLAPFLDLDQESAFTFSEGPVSRSNEEDQVAARHKFGGQSFMFTHYGIGAGRVHDTDLAQ